MEKISIFENISDEDKTRMLHCFNASTIRFKKDRTIISNVQNVNVIGIISSGTANLIRYDYNGNRSLLEKLSSDDIFGGFLTSTSVSELSVIATSECEVLFIDYSKLINRCKKNCTCHNLIINNVLQLLSKKIVTMNEKLEVLAKRSIREKLLEYFNILAKKQNKKNITLPFSFTDLADYLSIDRSAMMREVKNLKDEGFIDTNKRKITLNF